MNLSISLAFASSLFLGCSTSKHSGDTLQKDLEKESRQMDARSIGANSLDDSKTVSPPSQTMEVDPNPPENISNVIRCIFEDASNILWLGGEGGLFRRKGEMITCFDVKGCLGQSVTVMDIAQGKNDAIWCATSGGVLRIRGNQYQCFGQNVDSNLCDAWCIHVDSKGQVWTGTMEGVFKYDGLEFSRFPIPASSPDPTRGVTSANMVHCITSDRNGNIWIGTNGGAYVFDGKRLSNLSVRDGLPNNVVNNIHEDRSGMMWFGTTHEGISRYDGKRFENFTQTGQGKEIWSLGEDNAGNIWFSGKRLGVYCYDGNSFTHYGVKNGIDSPGILTVMQDKKGTLWLAGVNGLFKRENNGFTQVKLTGPW